MGRNGPMGMIDLMERIGVGGKSKKVLSKKKGFAIEDDESSKESVFTEEKVAAPLGNNQKKGNKGGSKKVLSKKKGSAIADDEFSMGEESVVTTEEKVANKKKGKNRRKGKKGGSKNDDSEEEGDNVIALAEYEDDAPLVKFCGKKKAKGKKQGSSFGLLGEDDDENDVENKEKDSDDEESDVPAISSSGKKLSKSKKSGGNFSSALDLLDGKEEKEEEKDESSKEEDEDVSITSTGKKSSKGSKKGLEHAIAGTSLYVVGPNDDNDIEAIKESAMDDVNSAMSRIDKSGEGVYVQASTLGSLEALLEFLKSPAVNTPVSAISIGPVHKRDVMKASVMLEKKKEYGTILAFDVKVTPEARELADYLGVKIFIADIICHLFDQFKAYIDKLKEEKKKEAAVFPCVLKIMPDCVFRKKDPIVLGVDVTEGTVKIGTPICVPDRKFVEIGRIAAIINNHKPVDYAKKGQQVAIEIIGNNPDEQQKMLGRHFMMKDKLVSKISRKSLDALNEHCADDLTIEEKQLLFKLKKIFKIP